MNYLSVCSGIEAATVAWHPLGLRAWAYSEIERFPCAVLAHHYPDTPNLGDMTRYQEWPDDLLVGGTPCQSFSVAGLRKGLDDPRGNLMLTYGAIAGRYRPRWLVWENVPGVLSSNGGRDFGTFLGMLAELGYGFAYRILDAQYFGVAQRRRRVFVVGHLGDWRRAAAVLFERESLSGHPAPRRETREGVAPTLSARTRGGGGLGTDFDCDGGLIASTGDVSHCLNAGGMGRQGYETETLVAHSLRGEGFDASEDGTGRGTPLVPMARHFQEGEYGVAEYETSGTLRAGRIPEHEVILTPLSPMYAIQERAVSENPANGPQGKGYQPDHAYTLEARNKVQAVAFGWQNSASQGASASEHITPTLDKSKTPAVTVALRGRDGGATAELGDEIGNALRASQGGGDKPHVLTGMAVRRLTPVECERLQGFPDGYTDIRERGKPTPDDPRYKALGNSMAVPCMRWIGERIAAVDAITAKVEAA